MSPDFAYFLKVNVAFAFFYAFYRLFFYKDTFFKLRRSILLAFFGLAMIYPLFNMQEWVKGQEPIAEVIFYYSLIITPSVEPSAETASIGWREILGIGLWAVYISGIVILTLRFISQLVSIIWLTGSSGKRMIRGVKVFALNKPAGPFSFFQWIFLHPESHTDEETEEILTHECTHANQWHSIDVITSEIINIICWINPFAWLLKREVRHNLEYLADNTVLESGYDCRSYQYHLLGLAHHHKDPLHLYNSFNVLHLKNRITMMNKKRSHRFGRAKYLLFLPLVISLMIVSNIEAVVRITKNMTREMTPPLIRTLADTPSQDLTGEKELSSPPIEAITAPLSPSSKTEADMGNHNFTIVDKTPHFPEGDNALPDHIPEENSEDHIFTVVERMPKFPGGDHALLKHISSNIKYPVIAQENGIQGRVVVSMVIDADGNVIDPQVIRKVDPSIDMEALRVISSLPKWEPGEQRGKKVRVKYTVPVRFRLQ